MTKASRIGETKKGKEELRMDCHQPGGPFRVQSHMMSLGRPEYFVKQKDSSELPLNFVIIPIIANNNNSVAMIRS